MRYLLSYQDVMDLLDERGASVGRSTVYRWVQKFGPELTKPTEKNLRRARVDLHVPFRQVCFANRLSVSG